MRRLLHQFISRIIFTFAVCGLFSVAALANNPAFMSPKLLTKAAGNDMESARKTAFIKAELAALQQVLPRFVPETGLDRVPVPTIEQLESMVEGLEVHDQRMNEDGYVGLVSIQFNEEAVAKFLLSRQVPFTTEKSGPVLVLPIFIKDGQRYLWEADNLWREIWLTEPNKQSLLEYVIPLGDGPDQEALPIHSATIDNEEGVKALKDRYGAKSLLIVEAEAVENAVSLSVYRSGPIGGSRQFDRSIEGEGKDLNRLLLDAAKFVGKRYNDSWVSARQVTGTDQIQEVPILALAESLTEWNIYGERLKAIPLVRSVELLSLGQGLAKTRVEVAGSVQQLQAALSQSGLELFPMTYTYVIQRSGVGDPRYRNDAISYMDEPLPVRVETYDNGQAVDANGEPLQDWQLDQNGNAYNPTPTTNTNGQFNTQGIY